MSFYIKSYFSAMKPLISALLLFTTLHTSAQTYWQQHVATKIDVRLDDETNFLHAREEFVYTNNSPDTLKSLYIHLWPNAYKHDHTPFAEQQDLNGNTSFYYSPAKDKGYIDSLDFTVDGKSVEHNIAENSPDIARIDLIYPLLPGKSVKIATPFLVKIPKVFSRLGHTDHAYFISQWFPKPAVYDQKGWHPISYLDQGEFYSEFGSYDVTITLPKNYVVMATGNCMDESENAWMDNLSKQPIPDSADDHTPESSKEMKTIHFHEDNVHDFAWFADKRLIVRKDSVKSPGTEHLVYTWAAYLPSYKKIWAEATNYLGETVKYYGKWVGPYPYNTIKAVLGDMRAGGGMEYPTVTIIDKTASLNFRTVVIHEAGHNWFYGMLGSNEREHPWMDEGMNTFYEKKTTAALSPDTGILSKLSKLNEELLYYQLAESHTDQTVNQNAAKFTKSNYGIDVYYKTWLMLRVLEQYMGDDDFEKGMKNYYNSWHHKHPYPENFRDCMQQSTSKGLDLFFNGMLFTDKRIDFTITKVKRDMDKIVVKVRNNGPVLSPVLVNAYRNDSLVAKAWTVPFEKTTTVELPVTDWDKVKIDYFFPDAKSANDIYTRGGISHRFHLGVRGFFGVNTDERYKLFVAPAVAYNQYDGVMGGLVLHNLTIPENRFRFILTPLYSGATGSMTGAGSVGYMWYPKRTFQEILLQADGKSFHYNETYAGLTDRAYARYTKLEFGPSFTLKEKDPLSTATKMLSLKGYSIWEDQFAGIDAGKARISIKQNLYGVVKYEHFNERTYNPFSYTGEVQVGADFAKVTLEGKARVDYNVRKKSLYVRAFLGKFFAINGDPAVTSRYRLNSSYSGINDYLYDGTYIGRNASGNVASQQVSIQEGGFKVPVFGNVNRSDNYMATINVETDLPLGKLPIRLFVDAGVIPNIKPTIENNASTTFLYEAGLSVHLIKDVVYIYVPIVMSNDFQNYLHDTYGNKKAFARGISFTMMFQNINWLRSPTSLLKKLVN